LKQITKAFPLSGEREGGFTFLPSSRAIVSRGLMKVIPYFIPHQLSHTNMSHNYKFHNPDGVYFINLSGLKATQIAQML
jgi:hypothetical protein